MEYPEIIDYDFSVEDKSELGSNAKARQIVEFAISEYLARNFLRERMTRLYNAHNGIITDEAETESIVKTTGLRSKTKYVKYRLGRSKLKLVQGEFLQINLGASVFTINRDAQNKKANRYKEQLGMALVKPQLEKARGMGYNVFPGMKLPDMENRKIWTADNFKTRNEMIMQGIIDDKLETESLKRTLHQNFIDLTIVSEVHGKIERSPQGIDTFRYINPKNAIYLESLYDPLLERTPFYGEVRRMYYHEILTNPEIILTTKQRNKLKQIKDHPTEFTGNPYMSYENGKLAFNIYTIQFVAVYSSHLKTIPAKDSEVPYKRHLSSEDYNKNFNQIQKDIENKKYSLDTKYYGKIWEIHRIGEDIYTPATLVKNIIQLKDGNDKYKPSFDYCGMLFCTIDGSRISLQEVITELERIYDDIRFQINRELRRIKGSVLIYDEAFLPKKKRFIDVFHDISEDGIVRINTSAEGNEGNVDGMGQTGIKAFDLGGSKGLVVLLQQAMDIERTIDRITGINDPRQGLSRATSTATANTNDLEASRSMTYDLFFYMSDYVKRVLLKLAAKTKLNYATLKQDNRSFIISDEDIRFLEITKELSLDDFGIAITDGKKEREVLAKIEQWFPQEINSGMLSSKDAAKFYMQSSFAKAIQVLEEAQAMSRAFQLESSKIQAKTKDMDSQRSMQIAIDDREDRQVQEKELLSQKIQGQKEIELIRGGIKGQLGTQDQETELLKAGAEPSTEIPELSSNI
jgi:hypothetical protein